MKRILPPVAIALFLLASSTASLAKPSTVRSIPPPDPVSSLSADALGVVNYYGGLALHEYLQGIQRAEDERAAQAAEEARLAALRAVPVIVSRSCGSGSIPAVLPAAPNIGAAIVARESGFTLDAKNCSSTASGKYQFLDSTWNGYGGYARASDAPEAVQDAKAAEMDPCHWRAPNYCR